MIKILFKIWPAFLPMIIFVIWYYKNIYRQKDIRVQDEFLELKKKYMFYALISTTVIVVGLLAYMALSQPATPHMEIHNDQVKNTESENKDVR